MKHIETDGMVVGDYSTTSEAEIVKSLLNSLGIDSFIRNSSMSNILPSIPLGAGTIELLVRTKDYDKSIDILNSKFDKKDME